MSYFRGLFGNKEMRILILGLDGAGKTTLLYRLQVRINEKFVRKVYLIFVLMEMLKEIPITEQPIFIV